VSDALSSGWGPKSFLGLGLLFFLLACLVHAPLFHAEPIQDDVYQVFGPDAPTLSEPSSYLLAPYWTPAESPGFNHYRPVQRFLVALERAVWFGSYGAMHVGAALWSALAAVFVFVFVRGALNTKDRAPPLLAALFFLLHPMHVEVMAQVAARGEIVVLLAAIGCCRLHVGSFERVSGRIAVASSGALFLLALLAKEHAIAIPALVVLCALARRWNTEGSLAAAVRETSRRWASFVVYPPALVAAVLLHVGVLGGFFLRGAAGLSGWSVAYRAHVATVVTGGYLQKMVVPYPLSADYSGLLRAQPDEQLGLLVLGAFALVGAVLLGCLPGRERPARALGVAWAAVSLFPFSHVVPCTTILSDRNAYLASAGAALALAALFAEIPESKRRLRRVLLGVSVVWLLCFGLASGSRSMTWRTHLELWSDATAKVPGSAPALHNKASALWALGRIEEAEEVLAELIRVKPDHLEGAVFHALSLHRLGKRKEGREELSQLIEANPNSARPTRALGRMLVLEGRTEEGLAIWEDVLTRFPQDLETTLLLTKILLREGRVGDAARVAEQGLVWRPNHPALQRMAARAHGR
jgi:protein O-mannosyl-transferase